MEEVRTLVTSYLIMTDKGPFAMCSKQETKKWENLAVEKGLKPKVLEITTHTQKMSEIGKHLFKIKLPTNNFISFRNSLIEEMRELCDTLGVEYDDIDKDVLWRKVSNKYNLSDMDFDEFHRCIMHKLEYLNVGKENN